jgi:hypothetical protein
VTDADDIWDLLATPAWPGCRRRALLRGAVDDFYRDFFGRNSIDDNGTQITCGPLRQNYCNVSGTAPT